MYNGKRAWDGLSQAQVVYAVAIQHDSLQFAPDASPCIAALSSACMATIPAQRPTFAQLVQRIAAMSHKTPGELPRGLPRGSRSR